MEVARRDITTNQHQNNTRTTWRRRLSSGSIKYKKSEKRKVAKEKVRHPRNDLIPSWP